MATVIIDDARSRFREGERLNGIEAAALAGIEIPHYCWHPGLVGGGQLPDVPGRDRHRATRRPARSPCSPSSCPACNTPVTDGTVLVTNSEKVARARAMVEEGLLLRHPIDCPICDKAGECLLAGLSLPVRPGRSGGPTCARSPAAAATCGDVTLFVDRCVLCSRCVRFTPRDQRHQRADGHRPRRPRGDRRRARLPAGTTSSPATWSISARSGPWATRISSIGSGCGSCGGTPGVCTGCATGCSIWIEENQDRIYRIKPRENPLVNQWWICNDGRYDYPHVHDPTAAGAAAAPRRASRWSTLDWTGLAQASWTGGSARPGRLAAVLSPFLTRRRGVPAGQVRPAARPRGAAGARAGAGRGRGRAVSRADSRSRPRSAPTAAAWRRSSPISPAASTTLRRVAAGSWTSGAIRGVWVSGGYKSDWIDEPTAGAASSG